MIKRTLYFGNPAYLKTKTEQLVIEKQDDCQVIAVPIEDIGLVIADHPQITITSGVVAKLLENNVALVTCNEKHHPTGLMLNFDGHTNPLCCARLHRCKRTNPESKSQP